MPTPATEPRNASLGAAAKEVSERVSTLARLELELAKLEVTRRLGSLGAGVGLGFGATVVAVYAVGFLFATIAVALAIVLDLWLAMLIVTLALFLIAGILGALAVRKVKGGKPVPEQALQEAKLTTEALKSDVGP